MNSGKNGLLENIRWFFEQREELISGCLSVLVLIGWMVFVLGFVFAHGVCCGDDAGLALYAKRIANGDYQDVRFGFDPHLMVILPTALGVLAFGNAYWVPGFSVLLVSVILLFALGALFRYYHQGFWFAGAALLFFLINYLLTARHFEQWFSALGEVPAALLLLTAILLFFHRRSALFGFLSGIFFSLAFLTKVVTLLALGAFIISLVLQSFFRLFGDDHGKQNISIIKVIFLLIGFVVPWGLFEVFRYYQLGPADHLLRWLSNLSYVKEFLGGYQITNLLDGYITKSAYFAGRFGVPFSSLIALLFFSGWMVQRDNDLKPVFFVNLSIFLFYSYWWFYFTYPLGRYYIVPLVIVIFTLALPLISSRAEKWRWRYIVVLGVWLVFTWQNAMIPFQTLEGSFFSPTERTKSLLLVSDLLSNRKDQDPIITKKWETSIDIRYISDRKLRFRSFNSKAKYSAPFWVAVTTDFVGLNERFLKYSDVKSLSASVMGCGSTMTTWWGGVSRGFMR